MGTESCYSHFVVSHEHSEKINEWVQKHNEEKHQSSMRGSGKGRHLYAGAIGGAVTYTFTPTTLGTVFKVKCFCGDFLDLSDYDSW